MARSRRKSESDRVSGRRCVSPARPRRVAIIRCRTVRRSRASIAWRATTIHCWRARRGASQHYQARGRMTGRDDGRSGSPAAVQVDATCASTARTSQHVTTSVISAWRVEGSTAGRATTCRSWSHGRNRRRQAADRGGYGFRGSRRPRRRPSASRRPARKDAPPAPVLRAAVGPVVVARSEDVRDRRARRLRDLPSLTDRARPGPMPSVSRISLLSLPPTRVHSVGETTIRERRD
jgi:hypothetical protein